MKRLSALLGAAVLLGACAGGPAPSGVTLPVPPAGSPVTDTYFGTPVPDPWRHLESVKEPAVQQWMRAEADATQAVFDRIPGRRTMLERIREIDAAGGTVIGRLVRNPNGRLFFTRRTPADQQPKLVWRDGPNGTDTVLVDPEPLSRQTGKTHAILDWQPSPDGSKLAYSIQVGGSEIGTLHVIDVASGRELTAPADRIRFASVQWLEDGSGFFYHRLREGYEKLPTAQRFGDRTVHFRALDGTDTDRPVFSPSRHPELQLPGYAAGHIGQVRGTRLALAVVTHGVERNVEVLVSSLDDAVKGGARWHRVAGLADQVREVALHNGRLLMRTALGAPRFRVVSLPLTADARFADARTLVPESAAVIEDLAPARDALYVTLREGAVVGLYRQPLQGGELQPVPVPVRGHVAVKHADDRLDGLVLSLASWTRVAKEYQLAAGGSLQRLQLGRDGAFDAPDSIESFEVQVRSHDGVMVPLSIIARKGLPRDGRNPTVVYGYGAYGNTEDAGFGPRLLAFLERGGVYAIAHVRGGGAYGSAWHDAGKGPTKPNTWKDGIAAAEWLVAQGWTSPRHLGIYGGSAGGIFVGRAITERPDLFASAVPMVGVMDSVRKELSANGPANIPEYGTHKTEAGFRALLAMSSYHHVKDGVAYPAVMAGHGVNDIRVDVWQSGKFVARLREATRGGKPVLMRLEYDGGHGSGGSRAQHHAQLADTWTFFFWQAGVPEFQPRRP